MASFPVPLNAMIRVPTKLADKRSIERIYKKRTIQEQQSGSINIDNDPNPTHELLYIGNLGRSPVDNEGSNAGERE